MTPEERAQKIIEKSKWEMSDSVDYQNRLMEVDRVNLKELIIQALTQPEITDEEIEKAAKEYYIERPNGFGDPFEDFTAGYKAALAKMRDE